jgi:hypothetical protein
MKKLLLILLCVPLIGMGQNKYKKWDDVYSNQKHNDFIKPDDILVEFGKIEWNYIYNRNEARLKLDSTKFNSTSCRTLFLEGFEGNVYTYINEVLFYDGYYNDSNYYNRALVILYSLGYTKSGYKLPTSKLERSEEIHFVLMKRNSVNKWDVINLQTLNICTTDDRFTIGPIEYIEIDKSNKKLLENEKKYLDKDINNQWILHLTNSGGGGGSYWRDHYYYTLEDLTKFILSSESWTEDFE